MNNLYSLKNDDDMLKDYVSYVLSLPNLSQDDSTLILHSSKTYGIVTPSMVMNWIDKGAIVIVYNNNIAA